MNKPDYGYGKQDGNINVTRDPGVDSLISRCRAFEQELMSKTRMKMLMRNLQTIKDYVNDKLIGMMARIYREAEPFFTARHKATDFYTIMDNKRLWDDLDLSFENFLLLRLPTFDGSRFNREKMHYVSILFFPTISRARVEAVTKLIKQFIHEDARRNNFEVDAQTLVIFALESEEEKEFITGNARRCLVFIGKNHYDQLNKLVSILMSFYSSKLAGIFMDNGKNKRALKTLFLAKSSSLLSNLINNGILGSESMSFQIRNDNVRNLVTRLLIYITKLSLIFNESTTKIIEINEEIMKRVNERLNKYLCGFGKNSKVFINRRYITMLINGYLDVINLLSSLTNGIGK